MSGESLLANYDVFVTAEDAFAGNFTGFMRRERRIFTDLSPVGHKSEKRRSQFEKEMQDTESVARLSTQDSP